MKYAKWELEQLKEIREKNHKWLISRGWTQERIDARDIEIKNDLDAIDEKFIMGQRIILVKTSFIFLAITLVYVCFVLCVRHF